MGVKTNKILGNVEISHDLKVAGWLDAPNVKHPLKGLFADETALRNCYPVPMPGWMALVGKTLPAEVYVVERGDWTATGETGGAMIIQIIDTEGNVGEYLQGFTLDWLERWIGEKGYATDKDIREWVKERIKESEPDLTIYVDKKSNQNIGGSKTFTGNVKINQLTIDTYLNCSSVFIKDQEEDSTKDDVLRGSVGVERKRFLNGNFGSVQSRNLRSDCSLERISVQRNVDSLTVDLIAEAPLYHYKWQDTGFSGFGTTLDYWKKEFPTAVEKVRLSVQSENERTTREYIDLLNLSMASCIVLARELRDCKSKLEKLENTVGSLSRGPAEDGSSSRSTDTD